MGQGKYQPTEWFTLQWHIQSHVSQDSFVHLWWRRFAVHVFISVFVFDQGQSQEGPKFNRGV